MKVIDGREWDAVPAKIEVADEVMAHEEEWRDDRYAVFCVKMDGKFVGCAQRLLPDGTRDLPILCGEWKDIRYFFRWVDKYCNNPYRFDKKDDETIKRIMGRAVELCDTMAEYKALDTAILEEIRKGTFLTNGMKKEIRRTSSIAFLKRAKRQ